MLALLACAPSDAGTILPSTLEGSQKSDALAGCRFALDGQLEYGGGEECGGGARSMARFELRCDPAADPVGKVRVAKYTACEIEIALESASAWPRPPAVHKIIPTAFCRAKRRAASCTRTECLDSFLLARSARPPSRVRRHPSDRSTALDSPASRKLHAHLMIHTRLQSAAAAGRPSLRRGAHSPASI